MMNSHAPTLYLADLSDCVALAQLGAAGVAVAFASAVRRAGATVVQTVSHEFAGGGVTCVLILRESHAVLHTWPESGTVNLDIFSCSSGLSSLDAVHDLGRTLGAGHISIREVDRADGHHAAVHAARHA